MYSNPLNSEMLWFNGLWNVSKRKVTQLPRQLGHSTFKLFWSNGHWNAIEQNNYLLQCWSLLNCWIEKKHIRDRQIWAACSNNVSYAMLINQLLKKKTYDLKLRSLIHWIWQCFWHWLDLWHQIWTLCYKNCYYRFWFTENEYRKIDLWPMTLTFHLWHLTSDRLTFAYAPVLIYLT